MTTFVFFCPVIEKLVPCTIKKNFINKIKCPLGIERYVIKCEYDPALYTTFNVTRDELYRYSTELTFIEDVYPYNTQAEIDYVTEVTPNKIAATGHKQKEFDRYLAIVYAICDITSIDIRVFLNLAEFISYELLFSLCNVDDRIFFQTISLVLLTEQPTNLYVPEMVLMVRKIFSKIDINDPILDGLTNGVSTDKMFKMFNVKQFSEFDYISFPLIINAEILQTNVNYITGV